VIKPHSNNSYINALIVDDIVNALAVLRVTQPGWSQRRFYNVSIFLATILFVTCLWGIVYGEFRLTYNQKFLRYNVQFSNRGNV